MLRLLDSRWLFVPFLCMGFLAQAAPAPVSSHFREPRVTIDSAPLLRLPGNVDSNSPSYWVGSRFHQFTSNQVPMISSGPDLENLGPPVYGAYDDGLFIRRWIEAVYRDPQGVLWGLYHREDYRDECADRPYFTIPTIGIARSLDGGFHWTDLGRVLMDFGIDDSCESSPNRFFAGGLGDPSWAIDEASGLAYIFYSAYTGNDPREHGVQIARIALADLPNPVGKVLRWDGLGFHAPGLGGIGRAVLSANNSWHEPGADAYWGPSVHWNQYLGVHVVLLNRTDGPNFAQEGIYILYVPRLDDPSSWTEPRKIVSGGYWYPQVVGDANIRGTDSLAGESARFFMHGLSEWRIRFERH